VASESFVITTNSKQFGEAEHRNLHETKHHSSNETLGEGCEDGIKQPTEDMSKENEI